MVRRGTDRNARTCDDDAICAGCAELHYAGARINPSFVKVVAGAYGCRSLCRVDH